MCVCNMLWLLKKYQRNSDKNLKKQTNTKTVGNLYREGGSVVLWLSVFSNIMIYINLWIGSLSNLLAETFSV